MSKKQNRKPTFRSLIRAGKIKPPITPDNPTPKTPLFRVGDWVRVNARQSVNYGVEFKIAHFYYHPLWEHYRFCAALTDGVPVYVYSNGYPAEDLQLVEGGLERSKGVLGELTGEGESI